MGIGGDRHNSSLEFLATPRAVPNFDAVFVKHCQAAWTDASRDQIPADVMMLRAKMVLTPSAVFLTSFPRCVHSSDDFRSSRKEHASSSTALRRSASIADRVRR